MGARPPNPAPTPSPSSVWLLHRSTSNANRSPGQLVIESIIEGHFRAPPTAGKDGLVGLSTGCRG